MNINPIDIDKDGYVHAPKSPGLGAILDTEKIEKIPLLNFDEFQLDLIGRNNSYW